MAEKVKVEEKTASKSTTRKKATKANKPTKPVKPTKSAKPAKSTKPAGKAKPVKIKKKTTAVKKTVKKISQPKVKKVVERKRSEVYIEGTKEVNLYNVKGKSLKKVKLPAAFDESFRIDLIRRAVKAAQANRRQPYGPTPLSGMGHSTSTWGKGRGVARVQRLKDGRRAVESPNNVGGRRAHPPTVERVWNEKINKKERQKARRAALAAVTVTELVQKRGHKFDKKITVPIILEDEFEKITKTQETLEIFQNLGVFDDVMRATKGKHIRAGKGKSRGRVYRKPKSILIIASENSQIKKGVRNLIGVDVISPDNLSIEDLAPGGDPGRLTIITESALKLMGNW